VFFSLEKSVYGTQCIFLLIWLCGKHLLVYIGTIKPIIVQPASKIWKLELCLIVSARVQGYWNNINLLHPWGM